MNTTSQLLKDSPANYVTFYTEFTDRCQAYHTGGYAFRNRSDDIASNEAKSSEDQVIADTAWHSASPGLRADSLPDDILIQIFRLVLDTHPARSESYRDWVQDNIEATLLIKPNSDYLAITQSCSIWRRVALGSKSLWTDIEISPFSPFLARFLSRAEAYVQWSGDLPLSLRLHDDCEPLAVPEIPPRMMNILTSVAPRLRSLQLGIHWMLRLHHLNILDNCLTHCKSGALTHLEVKTSRLKPGPRALPFDQPKHGFVQGVNPVWDSTEDQPDVQLTLPDERLEEVLRPVTSLWLNRLYPVWSSVAYHGLLELALVSRNNGDGPDLIPASSLALIFQSSPGLRTLRFGLKVRSEGDLPPNNLNDLEILHLESPCVETQQTVLQLISPGAKLFRVNIKLLLRDIPPQADGRPVSFKGVQEELHRCVARSRVTEFFLDTNIEKNLHTILEMMPDVRILGVARAPFNLEGFNLCSGLEVLHWRDSRVFIDPFKQFVSTHQLRRVVVTQCWLSNGQSDERSELVDPPLRTLRDISPVVETMDYWPADELRATVLVDGWDY